METKYNEEMNQLMNTLKEMESKKGGYVSIVLNFFNMSLKHADTKGLSQKSLLVVTGIDTTKEIFKAEALYEELGRRMTPSCAKGFFAGGDFKQLFRQYIYDSVKNGKLIEEKALK
jgi:microcystin degradation protein MlrC